MIRILIEDFAHISEPWVHYRRQAGILSQDNDAYFSHDVNYQYHKKHQQVFTRSKMGFCKQLHSGVLLFFLLLLTHCQRHFLPMDASHFP